MNMISITVDNEGHSFHTFNRAPYISGNFRKAFMCQYALPIFYSKYDMVVKLSKCVGHNIQVVIER